MGLAEREILGRNVRCVAALEAPTTYGTYATLAAANSVQIIKYEVRTKGNVEKRKNPRVTRDGQLWHQGFYEATCRVIFELMAPGGATVPDASPFLTGFFGVQTVGGSSVTYSKSADQQLPPSITALFDGNSEMSELVLGWVIDELKVSISEGEKYIKCEVSGPCRQVIRTGRATIAAVSAGSGSITFQTALDSRSFQAGSRVLIGTETVPGVLGTVDHTTGGGVGSWTVSPAPAGGQSGGAAVVPWHPYDESTLVGTPLTNVRAVLDIGASSDVEYKGLELTLKNNVTLKKRPGTRYGFNPVPGFFDGGGTLKLFGTRNAIRRMMQSLWFDPADISTVNPLSLTTRIGGESTGVERCRILMPRSICTEDAMLDVPEEAGAEISIPFELGGTTATAEDACGMVFDSAA